MYTYAAIQVGLIFIPGFIWARIDGVYGDDRARPQYVVLGNAFHYGAFVHLFTFVLYRVFGFEASYAEVANGSGQSFSGIADEILISLPVALVLSIFWLYAKTYKLPMRALHWMRATKRFPEADVWGFTFASEQPHVEYVHVRRPVLGFTYAGWVNSWSEDNEMRELLLRDAVVYTSDGDLVTECPHLYITFPKEEAWIEFPYSERKQSDV